MSKLKKRVARLFANPRESTLEELWPILEHYGYHLSRVKGSHYIFEKPNKEPYVIPVHNGKIKKSYIQNFIKLTKNNI